MASDPVGITIHNTLLETLTVNVQRATENKRVRISKCLFSNNWPHICTWYKGGHLHIDLFTHERYKFMFTKARESIQPKNKETLNIPPCTQPFLIGPTSGLVHFQIK